MLLQVLVMTSCLAGATPQTLPKPIKRGDFLRLFDRGPCPSFFFWEPIRFGAVAATRHRHILQEPTEKADGKEPEKMDLEAGGSFDAEPGSIERLKTCIRCYKIDSLTVKDSKGSVLNCLVEMFRKEIHLGFRISMFVLKDVIWNGVFSLN